MVWSDSLPDRGRDFNLLLNFSGRRNSGNADNIRREIFHRNLILEPATYVYRCHVASAGQHRPHRPQTGNGRATRINELQIMPEKKGID